MGPTAHRRSIHTADAKAEQAKRLALRVPSGEVRLQTAAVSRRLPDAIPSHRVPLEGVTFGDELVGQVDVSLVERGDQPSDDGSGHSNRARVLRSALR